MDGWMVNGWIVTGWIMDGYIAKVTAWRHRFGGLSVLFFWYVENMNGV